MKLWKISKYRSFLLKAYLPSYRKLTRMNQRSAMNIQKDDYNRIILIISDTYMHAFIFISISMNLLYTYSSYSYLPATRMMLLLISTLFTTQYICMTINRYWTLNRLWTLIVISFLQRKCHPVTWCTKKNYWPALL